MQASNRPGLLLMAVLGLLGCKTSAPTLAGDRSVSSTAPASHAATPAWIEEARHLYEVSRTTPPPDRPAFGRMKATLTVEHREPVDVGCPEGSRRCVITSRSYMRVERLADGVRLRPQCTVMAEDRVMPSAAAREPWVVVAGGFEQGNVVLRSKAAEIVLEVDRWTEPRPLPPRARDAWLYARTLTVSRATAFGIPLSVDGPAAVCPPASTPQQLDACESTRGSPVALLLDPSIPHPLNGELGPQKTRAEWIRERVLGPVRSDNFGGFLGRASPDAQRVTCEHIAARMRPFAADLVAHGVDLGLLLAGAAITDGKLYYPQVSLPEVAQLTSCLQLSGRVTTELSAFAASPDLDWQNRFRAACVLRLLQGGSCGPEHLRGLLDAGTSTAADDADAECVRGLIGGFRLAG